MEEMFVELIEAPEITLNITDYNPEFTILNDRSDKSSSGVWKHFGAIKHHDAVDKKHVYCTHCFFDRRIKKYQRSTSTGNLSKHLRKQHNISLNQTFRVKKDADNSIHLVRRETEGDLDKDNEHTDSTDEAEVYLVHDINEILISEVAKRPLLYKPQTVQEKGVKHVLRRQQWTEIYEALNHLIPLVKLPKIWKNIRDRYHKVRRMANIESDGKPKYRYYEQLGFLDNIMDEQKSTQYEQIEEEAEVDEFLISGDHDHYISSETIVLPSEAVAYEETICEPKAKKQKLSPKKQQRAYQIITEDPNNKLGKNITISSSNIIEESFANATSNDIFTTFEEELVTDDMKQCTLMHQGANIEVISSNAVSNASESSRKQDEFDFFGNWVAEVMRNMPKSKSRILQMDIMQLVKDADNDS